MRATSLSCALPGAVLLALLAPITLSGCEADVAGDPDAPPDSAPAGQGDVPRGALALNEVSPAGLPGADWVELVNRGDVALDLAGVFFTDEADRLDHYYELPAGTTLAPGARLVLLADDGGGGAGGDAGTGDGAHHAPFELGRAGSVFLIAPDGLPVDALFYFLPERQDGRTLARVPDGEGRFFPAAPTPGAANPEATP